MKKRSCNPTYLFLLAVLLLAACGPTPTLPPPPTNTPLPTPTLRPTFTPTVLARVPETAEPTQPRPTATPTRGVAQEPTSTPPEPTPTAPAYTPTPAATRAAGPAPKLSGLLFFPVFDPARRTYDIYRLDLAGGKMERFIEQASQPATTPDRKRIGWRSWKQDQRGLLSRPFDSPDTWTMIRFTEAARPDWAPDGQRFVFPSRQEPDRVSRLYLFTGIGDEPFIEIQRHGSPIVGRTPAFLPDGRIVYQGCVENACGLYLMDADGTNPKQLTEFKDDTAPAVSPDGKRIAYMSRVSGYWQVYLINTDGSGRHPLTDDWYWNGLPTWSPDGKYLAFVSTRDENWPDHFALVDNAASKMRLWVMDANGGNQRPLNDFAFRLDGIPAGVPEHEVGGWIEERMIWIPAAGSTQ